MGDWRRSNKCKQVVTEHTRAGTPPGFKSPPPSPLPMQPKVGAEGTENDFPHAFGAQVCTRRRHVLGLQHGYMGGM